MQKDFEFLAGISNNRMRILICLVVMSLAAGCASTPAPKQTVPNPVFSDSDSRAAVEDGAQAIADCTREQTLAKLENRPANYSKARERLAGALIKLQPGKVSPSKPEYERIAVCFETALAGIDRIIDGQKQGDEYMEATGWKIFDHSAAELLLVLEPHAGAGTKTPGRTR